MLTIIFCLVGIAYGQYPPSAPYPAAPYPPAIREYQAYKPVEILPPTPKYGLPPTEGGDLSPDERSSPNGYLPIGPKQESGGDVSPDELEVPRNTQIKIQDKDLQYTHGFSDDKGTSVREQGSLLSTNDGWEYVIVKKGSYSYISPEGVPVKVNYIADHNGFRVLPN